MVKFVDKLYATESVSSKLSSIKLKTVSGIGMINVYFITMALSEHDIFDIYSASVFKQRGLRRSDITILGVAGGYMEAVELTNQMITDCINDGVDPLELRMYFEKYVKSHT